MACVRATFEQLVVRGEEGMSWDEAMVSVALAGGTTYDSALIRLTAKVDSNLIILNRHVALEKFTVDAVVAEEEDQEEEGGGGGGGVMSFIQEHIVGSKKQTSKNNKVKTSSEVALMEAWEACKVKGYHGLHVFAKVSPATMPNNSCRLRYTPGQYAEALLNGFRAYYMFQRHDTLFEADALGLWGSGGGGCVEPVNVCYLVLAWQLADHGRGGGITNKPVSLLNITASAAAAAPQRQGRKRAAATQNMDEGILSPAKKRTKVTGKVSWTTQPSSESATTSTEDEEEEVTLNTGQQRDKIPDVWYSPDISLARHQQSSPQRPTVQKLSPPKPTIQKLSPQRLTNQEQPSPPRPTSQPPSPQKVSKQLSTPQKVVQEAVDDLSDVTFGFERSTPRGRGRRTTTTTASRKSMLHPQWPEEQKEELLHFFDTLNPSQTEQTCIALTCKFATMRFGQDLPSKQLYQWVQQKGRTVHPPPDTYTLPGEKEGVHFAAAELFRSLNSDVSESKRVAFTCRFMETQYGAKIHSKELYDILSGGGKKRGGRRGKT